MASYRYLDRHLRPPYSTPQGWEQHDGNYALSSTSGPKIPETHHRQPRHKVTVKAILENLMMEEVVSQPAALLPKQAHNHGTQQVDPNRIAVHCARNRSQSNRHVGQHFEDVVSAGSIEQSHGHHFRSKFPISLLELLLLRRLELVYTHGGGHDALIQLPDLEAQHALDGRARVEGGEDVCAVIACMGEDDRAPWMIVPVAHVVHLAFE